MIESDNEIDSDALEAGGYSARGPQADDRASLPSKLETVEQMEVDSSLPGCSSQRTADEQHNSSSFEAAAKADGPGYAGSARGRLGLHASSLLPSSNVSADFFPWERLQGRGLENGTFYPTIPPLSKTSTLHTNLPIG